MGIIVSFVVYLFFLLAVSSTDGVPIQEYEEEAPCPVLTFDCTNMPAVCANIRNAIHNRGNPSRLRRSTNPAVQAKNRRESGCTRMRPKPGMSCDEYPFATTYEGGKGATIAEVPLKENQSQGGQLSAFYRKNKLQDGDCFIVNI